MNIKKVDYLRLSITDRCNLNCVYCTPLEKRVFLNRQEVLSYEEMAMLVSVFAQAGISKVRITGGEPLAKKDSTDLVSMIKQVEGITEVSLTTNGMVLAAIAEKLKIVGLDRINISLDTLKKKRFRDITGCDGFQQVWAGIKEAIRLGLMPVKLNVILMRGINDDEIIDFVKVAINYPVIVRFIELFPTNRRSTSTYLQMVSNEEVMESITKYFGAMLPIATVKGNGPAEYYIFKDYQGVVGFINSCSSSFCEKCNRIRVDCAGNVYPCLFSPSLGNMKHLLRCGKQDFTAMIAYVQKILQRKPEYTKRKFDAQTIEMSSRGG